MKKRLHSHIDANRKKYMFLILSFIFGMILGYISLMLLSEETISELKSYLSDNLKIFLTYSENLDSARYFGDVLISEGAYFLLLWLMGLGSIGIFFAPLFMVYKGYTLAFCFAFILRCFDGNGLLFDIFVILSQNIIKIPAVMFGCMCCMSHALKKSPANISSPRKENTKGITFAYSLYMILSFLIYSAGILLECYVIPHFVFTFAKDMI